MNPIVMKLGQLVAVCFLSTLFAQQAGATYYPNQGDIYYNGQYYVDSYLLWIDRGPFSKNGTHPPYGYEHDLLADPTYITSCTSFTNLPWGYDDCPTAGVSEPGFQWAFSFGSFRAGHIQSQTWYMGGWYITHGTASSTPITLRGQSTEHLFCGIDSIWCMNSLLTKNLLTGYYMNWLGVPTTVSWIVP